MSTAPPRWPFWVVFILVTELCERFAFYGLTGSLVCFFKTLGLHSDTASCMTALFGALVYVTPVLGAYVADVHFGRFATIRGFCVLYIAGLALTTAAAWPTHGPGAISQELALGLAVGGLFVGVALGAGGIKSNVVVLGADQFELPAQAAQQASFFNFFYWCINIGATVAFLFLTNVALYGLGGLVPARFGFFASFAIPLAAFVLALAAFAAGRPWYSLAPPQGSVVADFLATLRAATRRSVVCCVQPHGASGCLPGRGCLLPLACGSLGLSFCAVVASFFLPAGPARDGAAIGGLGLILVGLVMLIGCGANTDWVRSAHADGARAAAEADAAAVVRILPLAACVVVFWMIYAQMSSNYQLQGFQMDLHTMGTKLSPATLNVFDSVVIMVLIPLVDRGLYPCLERLGMRLGMLPKIAIGFGFATASVFVAGVVERMRKAAPSLPPSDVFMGVSAVANATLCGSGGGAPLPMSSLSIWWQTPQYILIGFGEIFAAITCYELFYAAVPEHMRSVCQSINLLCTAFGSLAAAGLNSACSAWITDNLDVGHLDRIFFVLAATSVANMVLFAVVSVRFEADLGAHNLPRIDTRDPALSLSDSIGPGVRLTVSSGASARATAFSARSRCSTSSATGGESHVLGDPLLAVVDDS